MADDTDLEALLRRFGSDPVALGGTPRSLEARLRALEILVAHLIADRLDTSNAPLAAADAALSELMVEVQRTAPPTSANDDEETAAFRQAVKFAVFDVMQLAVNRLGD